jgi:hypothetical protein
MAVSKAENLGTLGDEGMRTERHSECGRQYVGILPGTLLSYWRLNLGPCCWTLQ